MRTESRFRATGKSKGAPMFCTDDGARAIPKHCLIRWRRVLKKALKDNDLVRSLRLARGVIDEVVYRLYGTLDVDERGFNQEAVGAILSEIAEYSDAGCDIFRAASLMDMAEAVRNDKTGELDEARQILKKAYIAECTHTHYIGKSRALLEWTLRNDEATN